MGQTLPVPSLSQNQHPISPGCHVPVPQCQHSCTLMLPPKTGAPAPHLGVSQALVWLYRLSMRLFMLASESSPCLLHSCSSRLMQLQLQEKGELYPQGQNSCHPRQCHRAGGLMSCPPGPVPPLQGCCRVLSSSGCHTRDSAVTHSLPHLCGSSRSSGRRNGIRNQPSPARSCASTPH